MMDETTATCPLCGRDNRCGVSEAKSGGTCWCMVLPERIPEALLSRIPPELRGKACVCLACVEAFFREQETQEP